MVLKERDDCTFFLKKMPKGAELAPAAHVDEAVRNHGGGAERGAGREFKK